MNLLEIPLILTKNPHLEYPVIQKSSCIDFSIFILFNFLKFDVGSYEALFELNLVGLEVIHLDKVFLVVHL